jgi:hypothetical protein
VKVPSCDHMQAHMFRRRSFRWFSPMDHPPPSFSTFGPTEVRWGPPKFGGTEPRAVGGSPTANGGLSGGMSVTPGVYSASPTRETLRMASFGGNLELFRLACSFFRPELQAEDDSIGLWWPPFSIAMNRLRGCFGTRR